jgi:hypothetical protein
MKPLQVLVWRPAELLNGRMAMIGFTLGALTQLRTGQTVWAQLNSAPFAYLAAYGMVVLASLANECASALWHLGAMLCCAGCMS